MEEIKDHVMIDAGFDDFSIQTQDKVKVMAEFLSPDHPINAFYTNVVFRPDIHMDDLRLIIEKINGLGLCNMDISFRDETKEYIAAFANFSIMRALTLQDAAFEACYRFIRKYNYQQKCTKDKNLAPDVGSQERTSPDTTN